MQKESIGIEGMHCPHCVQQVKSLLEKQAGVAQAEVNLAEKTATVLFDENITALEQLKNSINQTEIFKTL